MVTLGTFQLFEGLVVYVMLTESRDIDGKKSYVVHK